MYQAWAIYKGMNVNELTCNFQTKQDLDEKEGVSSENEENEIFEQDKVS